MPGIVNGQMINDKQLDLLNKTKHIEANPVVEYAIFSLINQPLHTVILRLDYKF